MNTNKVKLSPAQKLKAAAEVAAKVQATFDRFSLVDEKAPPPGNRLSDHNVKNAYQ